MPFVLFDSPLCNIAFSFLLNCFFFQQDKFILLKKKRRKTKTETEWPVLVRHGFILSELLERCGDSSEDMFHYRKHPSCVNSAPRHLLEGKKKTKHKTTQRRGGCSHPITSGQMKPTVTDPNENLTDWRSKLSHLLSYQVHSVVQRSLFSLIGRLVTFENREENTAVQNEQRPECSLLYSN